MGDKKRLVEAERERAVEEEEEVICKHRFWQEIDWVSGSAGGGT